MNNSDICASRERTLIIIPAFNEEDSIISVVDEIKSLQGDYDFIVVNDSSGDRTLELLETNRIPYLTEVNNLGIGGAVQAGYLYALQRGYDYAIQLDGDGQHDPAYLDKMISVLQSTDADICIGSRFIEGSGYQSSASRRAGIGFLNKLILLCTGQHVTDCTSGYRAVNRKFIDFYAYNYPQDYPEPEAIVSASMKGAKIKEVPVSMRERNAGTSSINLKRAIYYMFKVSISILLLALFDRRSRNK